MKFLDSRRAALGALGIALLFLGRPASAGPATVTLPGHLPPVVTSAAKTGRLAAGVPVSLALTLPLRNPALLDDFLRRVSTPTDPLYGHYLTSEQFAERFGPTQADYDKVADFARASGFTITQTHSNRTVLDVSAPASSVERAFGVQLQTLRAADDGRAFVAPDREPSVPASLAGVLSGVVGLDTAGVWKPHNRPVSPSGFGGFLPQFLPNATGSGPGGGLTPLDIKTAYSLNSVSLTGAGQTLALFELDGYKASDITGYENYFGLPATPLQNVLVDGYSGAAGSGAGEVTLDIELQIALAPGVSKIYVYEGPNSNAGVVDTYTKIATDNLAKSVSTSWGLAENSSSSSTRSAENSAFQQMAAQGQSIFAASGDSGAYDNGSSLSVDDPASQPFMTGVGGTSLTTAGAGGAYSSEKTWNGGSIANGGGGGGISTIWSIPSYQSGVISAASKGSTTMRNVPDVALNADPNTGYAIYFGGKWVVYGGTSCAAPLWSAFVALVNQQRASNGLSTLGFANTPIYTIGGNSTKYAADFHDIADGSTNLYYPAVTGFDDATGWGTFKGASLLTDLAGGTTTPPTVSLASLSVSPTSVTGGTSATGTVTLTAAAPSGGASVTLSSSSTNAATVPGSVTIAAGATSATFTVSTQPVSVSTGVTLTATYSGVSKTAALTVTASGGGGTTQILGNPGFENGSSSPAPWTVSSGVIDSGSGEAAHGGTWKAWMDGYGNAHTDTLLQTVAIPSGATAATLAFYLHIDTAETTKAKAYDTLKVQIRNSSGTVLATLATYSNLDKNTGYAQKSFNVLSYKGQTVQVYLIGVEDSSQQTSFVTDDFSLTVTQ